MQEYFEQYRQAIRSTISLYEATFSSKNPISSERANQVQQLKSLVSEAMTPKMIRDGWKQIRATIKTGWVIGPLEIYSTGNSQFRENVDRIIFDLKYRDDIFILYKEIGQLKEELKIMRQTKDKPQTQSITHNRPITSCADCKIKDKTINALQQSLKDKEVTNEPLPFSYFTSDAEELNDLMSSSLKKHGGF